FAALWSASRALTRIGRRRAPAAAAVCVPLLLIVVALVAFTRYGTWNTQRYLLPAYSALLPLVAAAWVDLRRRFPAGAWIGALGVLAVFADGALTLHRELSRPPRRDPWIPEAIRFLESRGIRQGYADHAEALVNTYRSAEAVVLQDAAIGRYPLDEIGSWQPRAILTARAPGDLAAALGALGCAFERRRFDGRALFYDLACRRTESAALPRAEWRLSASESAAEVSLAIDGDHGTRWASHAPQRRGMSFDVDLGETRVVAGARLFARGFPGDFPRGLRVVGVGPAGEERTLVELPSPYPGLRIAGGHVHLGPETVVEVRFDPVPLRAVRFVLTAGHSLLDWSITELELIGG
ncbi:MAG: hypothetical protein ACREQ9_21520, partial [Candidatus Binatia bacterium]